MTATAAVEAALGQLLGLYQREMDGWRLRRRGVACAWARSTWRCCRRREQPRGGHQPDPRRREPGLHQPHRGRGRERCHCGTGAPYRPRRIKRFSGRRGNRRTGKGRRKRQSRRCTHCNSSSSSSSYRRSDGRGRLRRLPSSSYYSWDVSFHVRVSLAAFRNAQNATASNYSSSFSNSAVQRASDLAAALATALEASDMVASLEARGLPVDST